METTIQAAHETEGTNTPQDQKSTYQSGGKGTHSMIVERIDLF